MFDKRLQSVTQNYSISERRNLLSRENDGTFNVNVYFQSITTTIYYDSLRNFPWTLHKPKLDRVF